MHIEYKLYSLFQTREDKEDVNQSVDSTPQAITTPANSTAPPHTPNNDQQPAVDEDGYCIQPRETPWNNQWSKKGNCLKILFK